MMLPSEHYLTIDEEALLLRIARETLSAWVRDGLKVDVSAYPLTPALCEKHGAFVTLTRQGELRGCVGYAANRAPLAESVRDNTINAASRDVRFPSIQLEEIDRIRIEVSALTPGDTVESPFKVVASIDEIEIGRDGLCIQFEGARAGLLLPQVPGHYGWDRQQFLNAVCRKAMLPEGSWRDPRAKLFRFSAQVFCEPE
jgi:AmmeMemoRadiSam system protein A